MSQLHDKLVSEEDTWEEVSESNDTVKFSLKLETHKTALRHLFKKQNSGYNTVNVSILSNSLSFHKELVILHLYATELMLDLLLGWGTSNTLKVHFSTFKLCTTCQTRIHGCMNCYR